MATKKHERVNISEMASVIAEQLKDYGYVAEVAVNNAIDEISAETVRQLQETSPKSKGFASSGSYAAAWTDKAETRPKAHHHARTVYNTQYRLTHLLEYGHVPKRSANAQNNGHASTKGGRVVGKREHIKPAQEAAERNIVEAIKRELNK